eukprot:CAMPEP_0119119124 /NCGR_PEP_ID=MMETSP1310-20130426/752_1 /TAXON_ID=464262 /ORGANISM="Genus nov. species nov., Strain RCC2339" /LENGTH=224 /DNA_ID=CAMNT_0007108539 /DNA_START=6 /DNA_END=676 /DNA_ORIENTATION=+
MAEFKVKLVVFDMAGTTVDEDNVVYKTLRNAIVKAGCDVTLETVLEHGAGKEKLQAIKDVMEAKGLEGDAVAIHAAFRVDLTKAYQTLDVKGMAGTGEVFQKLRERGAKVVLNTGYDRGTAESLVAKIGWKVGEDIDGLVTASDVPNNRPKPDMILLAMKETGVSDPGVVAKIGDSAIDVEEGKNAQCGYTFGVTTGAQTRKQLAAASPTAVVDSLDEMFEYLA